MKHKDKLLHFSACFLATLLSPWLALGLALGKEYGDHKAQGNRWDWLDMLANISGILLALTLKTLIL